LEDIVEFTYYGDLLGISSLYKLSPTIAKEKLNDFYNTVFNTIGAWAKNKSLNVLMFSDSLLIYGNGAAEALDKLSLVYLELIQKGLLLRGSIVKQKLDFEPRLTYDNFRKMLPKDDTLARAVGLSSTQKGARLLVEIDLARNIFKDNSEWLTHDGYVKSAQNDIHYESILRRICPTPDNTAYEVLYFWGVSDSIAPRAQNHKELRFQLEEIKRMVRKDISGHYEETVALLSRCETRRKYTEKSLDMLNRNRRNR
jgi:hypothetical protein